MLSLAVLISGRGSNLQAIQKNIESGILRDKARIAVVIASKADAAGLIFAKEHGLSTAVCPSESAALAALAGQPIDLICLAGYMRVLSADFVQKYAGRIINIHPTLLPKYPGLHVHEKVLAAGEKESGCTVHYVDAGVDTGKIIAQSRVPVLPDDTPELLAARVLAAEHILYAQVILQIAKGQSLTG
ncbi:MAG: phosphoribosylglycinamide formyltransferase [Candidatus Margulisbacteria bacterium]|jgi:phosphoribosylglycinamide formyltransferase-1|nr:phosphoribosylglycinamide formyltransferase [Candidatus Margulisiibacteriota bacterium]